MSEYISDYVIFMAKVRQFGIKFSRHSMTFTGDTLIAFRDCSDVIVWAFYFDPVDGYMTQQTEFDEDGMIVRYA